MTARVLVVGLDAMDGRLVDRWADSGKLETFARLNEQAYSYRLANPMETLPGAIWPEILTGRSCGKVPLYYHPKQLHTGEAGLRHLQPDELNAEEFYWVRAGRAGRRVAVVDMPQSCLVPGLNGLQMIEWGTHDRTFEPASEPPELLAQLRQRYGPHPVGHCDRHGENDAGYERLLAGLLHGIDQKTRIVLDLIEREDWDLLSCAYGETHCTGHQFWHFQDPSHPWYRADAPEALRTALETVYRRVDDGLGRLISAAGADADVLVIASHGMARAIKGTQLLPEVLARLGLGSGGGAGLSSRLRRMQSIISHAPEAARPFLRWLASTRGVKAIQRRSGALFDPLEAPETRAVALRNNRCGAIRLNLKGREPYGGVEPGAEASTLIADIRRALLDLRHPDNGEAIVEHVVTADEAFGPDHHPDVPDILVVFRQDLGPLERCVSDRVGRIHVPMYHPDYPRTGDHTPETRLWWLRGDGQPAPERRQGHVLDIAPTVLKLLGVDAAADADGRALV